jgi:hypothetical protein
MARYKGMSADYKRKISLSILVRKRLRAPPPGLPSPAEHKAPVEATNYHDPRPTCHQELHPCQVRRAVGRLGQRRSWRSDRRRNPTGLLDSAALLELVVWYEAEFDLLLTQEEINVDNLGSIDAMADYLIARKTT